jgi:hypothetical protein
MHAGSIEEVFEILLRLSGRESQIASTLLSVMVHKLEIVPDAETGKMEIVPVYETLVLHPELMGKTPPLSLLSGIKERSITKIKNALGETEFYVSKKKYVREKVPQKYRGVILQRLGVEV